MKAARIYQRVSTYQQDLTRQAKLLAETQAAGYSIAGVYKEKASGATMDRPELLRMIADLQPGDVVIAERMDRLSRLPLPEAMQLIDAIRDKGARVVVPGLIDLSEVIAGTEGVAKIVVETLQDMLIKIALQMARDEYELTRKRQQQGIRAAKTERKYKGRQPNTEQHERIIALLPFHTVKETAELVGCSESQVKVIRAKFPVIADPAEPVYSLSEIDAVLGLWRRRADLLTGEIRALAATRRRMRREGTVIKKVLTAEQNVLIEAALNDLATGKIESAEPSNGSDQMRPA